ncbi:RimK/LysX family protein [Photobacterium makurazakiensis]|uniref:putative ATP-dependent zinc protease n=1 Tax=Photobacterium makurazakiensis TaxID=2910234 RepID=UPI003D0CB0B1
MDLKQGCFNTALIGLASVLLSTTAFASDYSSACAGDSSPLALIGQKEVFYSKAADLNFRSRIDTGATRTSLHATNIEIEGFAPDAGENVGKVVNFITANELGESVHMSSKITHVRQIQNSLGSELRYSIELDLSMSGQEHIVEVNLKDRSLMSDKLLIGRNILACNYLVDVSKASVYGL